MSKPDIVRTSEGVERYLSRMIENAERHGIKIHIVGVRCPMVGSDFAIVHGKGLKDIAVVEKLTTMVQDKTKEAILEFFEEGVDWESLKLD